MKYALLVGRVLFSIVFLMSAPGHFAAGTISFAASKGLPFASFLVPASGVIAALGALSVVFGYKPKWGALLLIAFLVPATLLLHDFWNVNDQMARQMDMVSFMKNLSIMGAALIIAYFGTGPLSVDSKTTTDKSQIA